MPNSKNIKPEKYLILVVDDEPDIFTITELSLKRLTYQGQGLHFLSAANGEEAIAMMQSNPDIAVVLLDVVMETQTAGLEVCKKIRQQLGNHLVRILLRTGQPGVAPEKQVISEYDIDGYLPKAELNTTRLFTAVRTAIKAWQELVILQRHREILSLINDCVISLHPNDSLKKNQQRILETAVHICPTDLAVLFFETPTNSGDSQRLLLHMSTKNDQLAVQDVVTKIVDHLTHDPAVQNLREANVIDNGFYIPITLHSNLGNGWIFLEHKMPDQLAKQTLPLLAAHAANAAYASVAQALLVDREGPIYKTMML